MHDKIGVIKSLLRSPPDRPGTPITWISPLWGLDGSDLAHTRCGSWAGAARERRWYEKLQPSERFSRSSSLDACKDRYRWCEAWWYAAWNLDQYHTDNCFSLHRPSFIRMKSSYFRMRGKAVFPWWSLHWSRRFTWQRLRKLAHKWASLGK